VKWRLSNARYDDLRAHPWVVPPFGRRASGFCCNPSPGADRAQRRGRSTKKTNYYLLKTFYDGPPSFFGSLRAERPDFNEPNADSFSETVISRAAHFPSQLPVSLPALCRRHWLQAHGVTENPNAPGVVRNYHLGQRTSGSHREYPFPLSPLATTAAPGDHQTVRGPLPSMPMARREVFSLRSETNIHSFTVPPQHRDAPVTGPETYTGLAFPKQAPLTCRPLRKPKPFPWAERPLAKFGRFGLRFFRTGFRLCRIQSQDAWTARATTIPHYTRAMAAPGYRCLPANGKNDVSRNSAGGRGPLPPGRQTTCMKSRVRKETRQERSCDQCAGFTGFW